MKAIRVHVFGGPDVLSYEDVPNPTPSTGEVLVRVHAAGINPVDTYIRAGAYPALPLLPYTPGSDAAGVVEAVGDDVLGVSTGDRVYVAATAAGNSVAGRLGGAYAEFIVVPAAAVHPLAKDISFAQGAGVGVPYATAYRGLFDKAQAEPGETVLVHGASGAVGLAAVQLAVARGIDVVGTASTEAGRELVAEAGASLVLDHSADGYLDELHEATAGQGPDVILEMAAHVNLARDLDAVARFGRVVVIGSRGTLEIDPRGTMSKDVVVLGLALMNASADEMASMHAAIVAGLANGTLRPVVGLEVPLAEAARGHVAVTERAVAGQVVGQPVVGQVVLVP